MYEISEPVRLIRGWRRLVVIGFTHRGELIAKYDHDLLWFDNRVTDVDFQKPLDAANVQIREPREFVKFTGTPPKKVFYTMSTKKRFRSKTDAGICGVLLNTTSQGHLVLEHDNGHVFVLDPARAVQDIPYTFKVQGVISRNYICHYTLGRSDSVSLNDLLISDSGNIYKVIELDTENAYPKGEFKGKRLVQEAL